MPTKTTKRVKKIEKPVQVEEELHLEEEEDDEGAGKKPKWVWKDWRTNTPQELWKLVSEHRMRNSLHRAEKRLVLQLKALCRHRCKGEAKDGAALYKKLEKEHKADATAFLVKDLEAGCLFASLDHVHIGRLQAEGRLLAEVRQLPVAGWCDEVPGLSLLSLGQLVAETAPWVNAVRDGLLDRRKQESYIWKRLGVGLVHLEGEAAQRQRKAKDPDLAALMAYNPARRSILYVIGDNLIKAGGRKGGPQSRYYQMYLARKEYETANHPELRKAHLHRRAKRYVEKKLIRHLLAEWNKAVCKETAAAA